MYVSLEDWHKAPHWAQVELECVKCKWGLLLAKVRQINSAFSPTPTGQPFLVLDLISSKEVGSVPRGVYLKNLSHI